MKKIYLNEIAKEFDLKEHVIRFYDAKGLTPFIKRDANNYRYVEEADKGWFRIINCLKQTGLPLNKIKHYIDLARIGSTTVLERYKMIQKQKKSVEQQIVNLNQQLEYLDYKENYYLNLLKNSIAD